MSVEPTLCQWGLASINASSMRSAIGKQLFAVARGRANDQIIGNDPTSAPTFVDTERLGSTETHRLTLTNEQEQATLG